MVKATGPSNFSKRRMGISGAFPTFAMALYFAVTLGGTSITSGAFTCNSTGCQPQGMVEAKDGNFYGTAIMGGTAPGNPEGTVFKIAAGLSRDQ